MNFSKRGGTKKKIGGGGKKRGRGKIFKNKLNLGIEKNKNEDF